MMNNGRLLVVEGLEGAGKSTAILFLQRLLQAEGISVRTIREPGGTVVGEAVRHLLKHADHEHPLDPRAELLLFYAARVQLLETVVKPALQQGTWVLADRCELSSFAYQGGGRESPLEVLNQLSTLCVGDMQPDLLLYLDISPEIGMQRAQTRGTLDRIEQEPLSFFQTVHAAYQVSIKRFESVAVIDASQSLPQVEAELKQAFRHYWESLNGRS
jgi:dTMP kinase